MKTKVSMEIDKAIEYCNNKKKETLEDIKSVTEDIDKEKYNLAKRTITVSMITLCVILICMTCYSIFGKTDKRLQIGIVSIATVTLIVLFSILDNQLSITLGNGSLYDIKAEYKSDILKKDALILILELIKSGKEIVGVSGSYIDYIEPSSIDGEFSRVLKMDLGCDLSVEYSVDVDTIILDVENMSILAPYYKTIDMSNYIDSNMNIKINKTNKKKG